MFELPAEPALAISAIAEPLVGLLPIVIPEAIDITEPSDMVIMAPLAAELDTLVGVETARAATGSVFHSIVIAGREGVAIGSMLAGEVILDL
jgi:hypothetical protein